MSPPIKHGRHGARASRSPDGPDEVHAKALKAIRGMVPDHVIDDLEGSYRATSEQGELLADYLLELEDTTP